MRLERIGLAAVAVAIAEVVAACGGDAAQGPTRIAIDPAAPTLAAGISLDVTATYLAANGTSTPASDATWSVGDAAVATISPLSGGRATLRGVKAGTTTLAVIGRGVTNSVAVTVTSAELTEITITPPVPSVAAGTAVQLTATGTFSDMTHQDLSSMVTWSSTATASATVDAAGLLEGVAAGHAMITATLGKISGAVDATVTAALLRTLHVTPTNPTLPAGVTQQVMATGVFSDGSHQDLTAQVVWSSSSDDQATVSSAGIVTAVATGTAAITASKDSVSGATQVTVTDAVLRKIDIGPAAPKLALGLTLQLTATGTFSDRSARDLTGQVTWVSATPEVAAVSGAGLASSLTLGTTQVTARKGDITGTTTLEVTAAVAQTIQVTPVNSAIALGTSQPFTAMATLSDRTMADVTAQVTWSSSDETVAVISSAGDSAGVARSKARGSATITATLVQPSGNVAGFTVLTVRDPALLQLDVTPATPSLAKGLELDFVAKGTFTDGSQQPLTDQVTWESSNTDVATISNAHGSQGRAHAVAEGTATIHATFVRDSGNVEATATVTVTVAELLRIEVAPESLLLPIGHNFGFQAIAIFTDGAIDVTEQVSWAADAAVATISNVEGARGRAVGVALGVTAITATLVRETGNVSGSATLTITAAVVDRIVVAPATASLAKGLSRQYVATATFSDTTSLDVTAEVTWESSNTAVAQISNADDKGTATAVEPGAATISASLLVPAGSVSGTAELTVTDPILVGITVTPDVGHVAVNGTRQFTATGQLSDHTSQGNLAVAWRSRDLTVAEIDAVTGLARGVALGSAPIVASFGTVPGNATLSVEAPPVEVSIFPGEFGSASPIQPIFVTFNEPMAIASFVTEPVSGPCTGTLQVSPDNFVTCAGLTPAMLFGAQVVTAAPAVSLDGATNYKIRVLGSVTSAGGVPLGADVTQTFGWFTTTSNCTPWLVISQVYGGGSLDGAPLRNAFIELHNRSAQAVSLTGFAVQYATDASDAWQSQPLPAVSLAAGAYFLIQEGGDPASPLPFPVADLVPADPFAMDPAAGKVALTSVPDAMTDACPVGFTHVVDFVGYGAGLSCFEGGGGTPSPGAATAALRGNNGCTDHNDNGADFTAGTPSPRGTAIHSSTHICTCGF